MVTREEQLKKTSLPNDVVPYGSVMVAREREIIIEYFITN